jgi:asparagine N-glycosylation enzyme membrane subunit Stt3
MKEPVIKRSFAYIGIGIIIWFFCCIFIVIGAFFLRSTLEGTEIFAIATVVVYASISIGTLLLFLGFTLPMGNSGKKQNTEAPPTAME